MSSGRSPTNWERATTEWELVREADVLDLGEEVMFSDFAVEHLDGRRALFEIVGFRTPEYLDAKLSKIRAANIDNLVVAVSGWLDCAKDDFGTTADCVLWFKTGIQVYEVVEQVEECTAWRAGQSYRNLHETGVPRPIWEGFMPHLEDSISVWQTSS